MNKLPVLKDLVALVAGLFFGVGLAASGMTDPAIVLGFLDIAGNWIPDLLFVMAGATAVTLVSFRLILKSDHPIFESQFFLPSNRAIDKRLVLGAMIFGIGWGIYGYCPGPALGSLVYLKPNTFIFAGAMLVGMWLAGRVPANHS